MCNPTGYTAINGGYDCSIKNSFYLLGSYQYAVSKNATFTGVTTKDETYMKSQAFVDELNKGTDVWIRDDEVNEGYPILRTIKCNK